MPAYTCKYHTREQIGNSNVSRVVSFDVGLPQTQHLSVGGRHPQQEEHDDYSIDLVGSHARPQGNNVGAKLATHVLWEGCTDNISIHCVEHIHVS